MKKSKSGFTIVELAVVIVVIAILATIILVSYNRVQAQSRDARRLSDVADIQKAMELYYSDNGVYPFETGSTGSAIDSSWYSSGDASWNKLKSKLTKAIDQLPVDPKNKTNGRPYDSDGYAYGIFVTHNNEKYCGSADGMMYLIVYRLEIGGQKTKSDGTCATKPVPASYSNGASTYLSVK